MASSTDFLPSREADLVNWANNFGGKLGAAPTTYGCTAAQATAFNALATSFDDAYETANDPSTRSPTNIIAKDAAKDAMIANARMLAGIIQKYPGTTDAMRSDLGLTVPSAHTPIGPPVEVPIAEVIERIGTTVRYRIHDGTGLRRKKPDGVQGARVYSFVGPSAPVEIDAWNLEGQVTRTFVDIEFPATTAPGTVVWFTAQWYSPRGETGPGCAAISTVIAGGAMEQAA